MNTLDSGLEEGTKEQGRHSVGKDTGAWVSGCGSQSKEEKTVWEIHFQRDARRIQGSTSRKWHEGMKICKH
jgi:hypothetical protein